MPEIQGMLAMAPSIAIVMRLGPVTPLPLPVMLVKNIVLVVLYLTTTLLYQALPQSMLSTTKDAAGGPIVESVLNKKTLHNKTLYEVYILKKLPAFQ